MFVLWLFVVLINFLGVFFFDENVFYLVLFSVLFLPDVFSSQFLSSRVSLHSYATWLKSSLSWLLSFFYCDTTLYRSYTRQLLLPYSQKLGLAQHWMLRLAQFYYTLHILKMRADLLKLHTQYLGIFNLVFFTRFRGSVERTRLFATKLKQLARRNNKIKPQSLTSVKKLKNKPVVVVEQKQKQKGKRK